MRVVLDANVVVAGVCWQGEGWLCLIRLVEPAPLGKPRSRDGQDDPYLAAALAAEAGAIVTYDRDLLDLGKPFGIPIVKPTGLLQMLGNQEAA